MTTQSTIDKLIELRLTSMSDAFLTQLQDARMRDISFEDRFGMLVDIEYSNRKSNSLKRLEYSCAMKSHFRKSGNQMSGKWKSSHASLLA